MKKAPVLQTARLNLREITEEDTCAIVTLRSDPNVYKYFVLPHQITEKEHLTWYKDNYLFDDNKINWIASDHANNLVGVFGVKRETKDSKEAEVSYILSPKQYGRGYAAEAVNRLIQFCLEEWRCVYVTAVVHEANSDSIRFAEKLGFEVKRKRGSFIFYKKKCMQVVF